MFTGLIQDVGTIEQVAEQPAGRELRVRCAYTDLVPGESIAVNGVCLTVRSYGAGWFTAAAVTTTLERTTLAHWTAGTRVNLERSLRAADRMGGHLVQGHVDGVGTVETVAGQGSARLVRVALPAGLGELVVPQGAIAVDGVSLTVHAMPAPGVVELSLIEYTLSHTTLAALAPGARVHVEVDVIGKYVQRLLAPYLAAVGAL